MFFNIIENVSKNFLMAASALNSLAHCLWRLLAGFLMSSRRSWVSRSHPFLVN